MNYFQQLPGTRRSPSGLEWRIFKHLVPAFFVGTVALLASIFLVWTGVLTTGAASPAAQYIIAYQLVGLLVLHWIIVGTVAIGCIVVMVMKGPGYIADAYPPKGRRTPL